MRKPRFYFDDAGDPRARGESFLARFLESDVQGSAATAREILDAVGRVEAGDEDEWEMTGNAFTLLVSPDGAAIEPGYQDEEEEEMEPERVSLEELRSALDRWIELLES